MALFQYQQIAAPLVASQPTETRVWRPIYPDLIFRTTTDAAHQPYFMLGPLVPIPNPVIAGVLDDKIHLGTKESLGVTQQPTLGGWQAW